MKISDLVKESHDRAKRKGFYDPPPSVESRLCLIHSEISEALEEYRDDRMATTLVLKHSPLCTSPSHNVMPSSGCSMVNKPEGFPTELADVVIRVCDWEGSQEENFENVIEAVSQHGLLDVGGYVKAGLDYKFKSIEAELLSLHMDVVNHPIRLASLFLKTCRFAGSLGIDLEKEIRIKSDFNETRPPRHGRVRL